MNRTDSAEPRPGALLMTIDARARDLGGFSVGRVLPAPTRRLVGPFIFFDHIGPADLPPDRPMDVRPHPHINLATVTYLFEGQILHRDSVGSVQTIEPGAINWMTAGRGIAHSERSPDAARKDGMRMHGIQLWVALPKEHEETEPSFRHHPSATLPALEVDGVTLRVLAGSAFGVTSPVETFSSLFYVDAVMPDGSALVLPEEHEERAVYVVEGTVRADDVAVPTRRMAVFQPGGAPKLVAEGNARVVLLGGSPLDGPRHIWWNFVSSSEARIEQAKRDWKEGRFAKVADDELEFIPLPDR